MALSKSLSPHQAHGLLLIAEHSIINVFSFVCVDSGQYCNIRLSTEIVFTLCLTYTASSQPPDAVKHYK